MLARTNNVTKNNEMTHLVNLFYGESVYCDFFDSCVTLGGRRSTACL